MLNFFNKIKLFFKSIIYDYDFKEEEKLIDMEISDNVFREYNHPVVNEIKHEIKKVELAYQTKSLVRIMEYFTRPSMFDKPYAACLLACLGNTSIFKEWKDSIKKPYIVFNFALELNNAKFAKNVVEESPELFYDLYFSFAIKNNNLELVKYLVENKNIDLFGGQCKYMREATKMGHNEIVKYLITQGCPPYACAHFNLKTACKTGNMDLVRYLVEECNCRVNLYDNYLVRNASNLEIKNYLIEKGADPA